MGNMDWSDYEGFVYTFGADQKGNYKILELNDR